MEQEKINLYNTEVHICTMDVDESLESVKKTDEKTERVGNVELVKTKEGTPLTYEALMHDGELLISERTKGPKQGTAVNGESKIVVVTAEDIDEKQMFNILKSMGAKQGSVIRKGIESVKTLKDTKAQEEKMVEEGGIHPEEGSEKQKPEQKKPTRRRRKATPKKESEA